MEISLFSRDDRPHATIAAGDWSTFVDGLRKPQPNTIGKRALPLWSPAVFAENHRKADNVERVYALGFDVDEDPIPDGAAIRSALAGILSIAHTSSSSTQAAPRWRLIVALSRPVTGEEYSRLWLAVESMLPFPVGRSRDASRAWYLPREGADGSYELIEIDGAPLDVDAALEMQPAEKAPTSPVAASTPSPSPTPAGNVREAAAAALGAAWPARGKGRHEAQRALAGALVRDGWSEGDAVEILCSVCRVAGDEDRPKRQATVRDTIARASAGKSVAGWTALERHVGPAVVKAGRLLLDPYAEARAKLEAEIGGGEKIGDEERGIAANDAQADDGRLGFECDDWETEPPPIEYLVEGLVPRGCVGMIFGRADALKTWTLFSLGISVAKGVPWLGLYPTTQGRVGIVDYETGRHNMRRRLYMLRAGRMGGALATKSFAVLKPNDKAFWSALAKEHFDLVIVDSLRKANPGGDENDSDEATVPLNLAAEFSEATGCAVLFIHHAKKSSDDGWPEFRGSAAIEDQVDVSFAARKIDVSPEVKRVEIKCTKPGDMRTPDPFSAEIVFDDGERTAKVRLAEGDAPVDQRAELLRDEILRALEVRPYTNKDEIAKAIGRKKEDVRVAIDALVAIGAVKELPVRGFSANSPAARRRRIGEATRIPGLTTPQKLARAAHVHVDEVHDLIASGALLKSATGYLDRDVS